MDVNSIMPAKMQLDRPAPIVSNTKSREKQQDTSETSAKSVSVSMKELDTAVAYANETGQLLNRKLNFEVDNATDKIIVKVIDEESGDVVRQVPAAEMLRISAHLKHLREMNDQVMGAVKSVILDVTY